MGLVEVRGFFARSLCLPSSILIQLPSCLEIWLCQSNVLGMPQACSLSVCTCVCACVMGE